MANLFHSLVVIGAGISGAACGGTTSISSGGKPDEAAGSANGGSQGGGAGGQPVIVGPGGAGSSTGGNLAIGGFRPVDPPPSTGGPLPDAGTLAQWSCSSLNKCANSTLGFQPFELTAACAIDPVRPRSASDCVDSQWFRCFVASFQGRRVLVNCSCMPKSDAGCLCSLPFSGASLPAECLDHDMLCGCAYTGIAH